MGREQIAYAIDKPQERSLAVGEVDIGNHPVHPRLSAGEEPCCVDAEEQIVCIRVGRDNEQHAQCQYEE